MKNSFNLGKDDGPAYITDGKMLIGNILVVMKIYQALEPPLLAKNKPIIGLTLKFDLDIVPQGHRF